ncbi:GTP-binding protein, partial [Bifidobacterium mongoliense]|uniref:GTP-binding protein n=1 Tax=Bifidobacterium mongoliense TaxID=518643 RepID=UPI002A75F9F5
AHTAADWTVATLAPGVVAMSIRTSRPLHPGRLSEFLQREAAPMHIRGRFTFPNKPFFVFAWEADPRGSEIAVVDEADTDASSLGGLDDDGALRDGGVTHDGLAHGGAAYVDAAADGVVSDRLVTAVAGE